MDETIALGTRRTPDLGEHERDSIVTLCNEAHRVNFGLLLDYLPADGLYVLACAAGRPASHAVVTTRWLQPGGLPLLRTAFVDAVAVAPVYQGRGVGSALMRHLALASRPPVCNVAVRLWLGRRLPVGEGACRLRWWATWRRVNGALTS